MQNKDVLSLLSSKLTAEELAFVNRYIESLEGNRKDLMILGDNEVFTLKDKQGDIRALKKRVRLSAHDRTLVQIVSNGPYVFSAKAYEVIANETGIQVVFPTTVMVNGKPYANPHLERDPRTGRILTAYARAVAYRYSAQGVPQVADWTTIYDIPAYRLQDLIAKAKKNKDNFRLLPAEMTPPNQGNQTWAKYMFDESTNLWVNTSCQEAIDWYSNLTSREKKIIDTVQTFARRNVVKHLIGMDMPPGQVHKRKEPNGYEKEYCTPIQAWDFEAVTWIPRNDGIIRWNGSQYAMLRDKLDSVISANETSDIEIKAVGASQCSEEEAVEAEITDEEVIEAETVIRQPEAQPEEEEKAPIENKQTQHAQVHKPEPEKAHKSNSEHQNAQAPAKKTETPDEAFKRKLWNNFLAVQKNCPDEFNQAVKIVGPQPTPLTKEWIMEVLAKANSIIDQEADK